MRTSKNVLLIAAVVATTLIQQAQVLAQATPAATPSAANRQQARNAYARGQDQFRFGHFQEAQAAFEEAYAAVPNPVVLLSIAESQERQENFGGAVETLERYLREKPDAADRGAVQARIDAHRARRGHVHVTSTPGGAAILVDGNDSGQRTPADLELSPGDHTIGLSMDGYLASASSVTVMFAGTHAVEATLEAAPPPPPAVVTEPEPAAPAEEPSDAPRSYTGAWIAGAIGGAALVGGTVLGYMALNEQSHFDTNATDARADRGERYALFADVCLGVAVAAAATAIVLYVTAPEADSDTGDSADVARVQWAPIVSPDGAGVAARGSF